MAIAEDVTILRTSSSGGRASRLPLRYALLSYGLMLLALLAMGLPMYWMVAAAFKENSEIYQIPVTWVPHAPTLENFGRAWRAAPFGRYYLNTIITTALGSGAEIVLATTSAYAFAFLRFPKKEWFFLLLLAALMVPDQVTILTNYLTIARLGWVDTYQGIIVPGAAVAYGTFLLRQTFLSLPREVLDAARVDGAGHLRTLWSVVIPLSRPALVTFGLISIVAKWNNFLWPLVATNTQEMRVLPIGIYRLLDQEGTTQWGTVMAGTIFVVLPVLIVFLWAQKHIVEGIAAGAVKG
ncbi:MAG TPA: carbohydrate ABC transporter permease [Herpetosiphonaceae bacterium]